MISTSPEKSDALTLVLGVLALVASIGAAVFAYLVFNAAALPSWMP